MGNVLERFCPHRSLPIFIQDLIGIYRAEALIKRDNTLSAAEVSRRLSLIIFPTRAVRRLYDIVSFVIELRKTVLTEYISAIELSAKNVSEISVRALGASPNFGRLFMVLAFVKIALERDSYLAEDKSLEFQLCARFEQTGAFDSLEKLGLVNAIQRPNLPLNYAQVCLAHIILISAINYVTENAH